MIKKSSIQTDNLKSRKLWIIENVLSLIIALLIVFIIRSSVFEAFKIPSGSMIPTLFVGDFIFVNKFAYGLKIPFSDLFSEKPIYLLKRNPPQRGDIVVFLFPKDENIYYIKRVIGLPGDQIEIKNKALFINHQIVDRDLLTSDDSEKIFNTLEDSKYSSNHLELYTENLDQVNHTVMLEKSNMMSENFGPVTVPPDHLFVMGDNRDYSNDSRYWGFVPLKNVKGKAVVVWLSFWANLPENHFVFRLNRIGKVIH